MHHVTVAIDGVTFRGSHLKLIAPTLEVSHSETVGVRARKLGHNIDSGLALGSISFLSNHKLSTS